MPRAEGLVVAVHSAAGKRACGGDDVAPGQQMRGPGVTIITFAAVVADGLPQGGVAASICQPLRQGKRGDRQRPGHSAVISAAEPHDHQIIIV